MILRVLSANGYISASWATIGCWAVCPVKPANLIRFNAKGVFDMDRGWNNPRWRTDFNPPGPAKRGFSRFSVSRPNARARVSQRKKKSSPSELSVKRNLRLRCPFLNGKHLSDPALLVRNQGR